MGTSAGPSLQGIGRGGDSNLVLEMDAHDAKSYPGEPTTNVINTVMTGWTKQNGCTVTATGETFQGMPVYRVFFPDGSLPRTFTTFTYTSGSAFTMHVWYRFIAGGTGTHLPQPYITASGGTVTAMFNLYRSNSGSATDVTIDFAMPQMEEKSYATPFVREGNGGTGTYNARPATTNLMIHGNVGTGTSFYDSSPSKHTITSVGGATHSNTQSKFSGGSFYLDGGDYLTIAPSSDFDFGTGSFTIDAWIRRDNLTNDDTIWGNGVAEASATAMWYFNSSGELRFLAANNTFLTTSSAGIAINTLYHIALVKNGTTLTAYVNGVSKGSATVSGSFGSASQTMHVGARDSHSAYIFTGYMDEFRVTKGTPLWLNNFTPPTRRNSSAPVVDRSGNHNGINLINGTDSGGTAYRTGEVIEPLATAVLDFDGTDDYAIVGDSDDWNFGSEPFAIEQWLYFTDFSPSGDGWNCALQQYAAEADRNGWMLFYNNGSDFQWRLECTATTPNFMPTHIVTGCSLNTWHLFTISRQGSVFKMYIDGVLRGTDTSNPTFDNIGGPMYVGNYAAGDPHEFQGKMGALRIYKGTSLSDEQVKENFRTQSSRFNVLNWGNRDIVKDSLLLWLDAGVPASYSGSGSVWTDLATTGSWTKDGDPVWTGGGNEGYFDFDGTGDGFDLDTHTTTLNPGTGDMTWETWCQVDSTTGDRYIYSNYESGNDRIEFRAGTGGKWARMLMNYNGTAWYRDTATAAATGTWVHLVVRYDRGAANMQDGVSFYVNGVADAGTTNGGTWVQNANIAPASSVDSIGRRGSSSEDLDGKIAVMRIYNKKLSASEIEQNFTVQRQRFVV